MTRLSIRVAAPLLTAMLLLPLLGGCTPPTIGAKYGGTSGGAHLPFLTDAELDRELDLMKGNGATWLRFDLDWSYVEPQKGVFHWGLPDRVMDEARQRGFKVVMTITYSPSWAISAAGRASTWPLPSHFPPVNVGDFANFASAAVNRYKAMGVKHWSIWNEPNWFENWGGGANPTAYTRLLQAAYPKIKAADRSATVISAGLAPAFTSGDRKTLHAKEFLTAMYTAGVQGEMDAVGMHPYSFPAMPMWAHVDNPFYNLPQLYNVMNARGDGAKKIWMLEFGGATRGTPSMTEAQQRDYINQAYRQLPKWPWAGPMFWYSTRDTGSCTTCWWENLGIYNRNWTAKLGAAAFRSTMATTT